MNRKQNISLFFITAIFYSNSVWADILNPAQISQYDVLLQLNISDSTITEELFCSNGFFRILMLSADSISPDHPDSLEFFQYLLPRLIELEADHKILSGPHSSFHFEAKIGQLPGTSTYDTLFQKKFRKKFIITISLPTQLTEISVRPGSHYINDNGLKVGIVVFHQGIPINDLGNLPRRATIELNWHDPWASHVSGDQLKRHHKYPVMSFLYIEPYQVRHEIIIRLRELETWLGYHYNFRSRLGTAVQDSLKEKVVDFLATRNMLTIRGQKKLPEIGQVDFVDFQLSGIQSIQDQREIPYYAAFIGVNLIYPDPDLPDEVELNWDLFSQNIKQVQVITYGPAGPWPYTLTPENHHLIWRNFLSHYKISTINAVKIAPVKISIPWVSVLCLLALIIFGFTIRFRWLEFKNILMAVALIASSLVFWQSKWVIELPLFSRHQMSNTTAKAILSQLLRNAYRAFDFKQESAIYDQLSLSVSGDLLSDIYLQTRKNLEFGEQGGLRSHVDEVNVMNIAQKKAMGDPVFYCKWRVRDTIDHWGHRHVRQNEYQANISLKAVDGYWKISNIEMIDQQRL